MHSAPAVSFPVGRSRFQGLAAASIWLAAAVLGAFWFDQQGLVGWRQGVLLAVLLGTGAVAARAWRLAPAGVLRWDGQAWCWEAGGAAVGGVLAVQLDFQKFLLLRLRDDAGAPHWLWLEQSKEPARWAALRRAACAHAGAGPRRGQDFPGAAGQVKP